MQELRQQQQFWQQQQGRLGLLESRRSAPGDLGLLHRMPSLQQQYHDSREAQLSYGVGGGGGGGGGGVNGSGELRGAAMEADYAANGASGALARENQARVWASSPSLPGSEYTPRHPPTNHRVLCPLLPRTCLKM